MLDAPCGKTDSLFVFENTQHRGWGKPWSGADCHTTGSDAVRMLVFLPPQLPQVKSKEQSASLRK
jgi:hypothetical protein